MPKSVEATRAEFSTVRTGRASPHLLDRIDVDYYGAITPLRQLAQISATEARLLTITPYDKNSIKAIEKAILESDVGLTPSNDGKVIRLQIPELTEERRARAGQGRARDRRAGPRGGAQHPPRRDARPARAEERGRGRLRRRAPRRGRAAEADRRARRRDRHARSPARKKRSSRCDRGRARGRATSRSSPTATGAGPSERGLPVLAGTRPGADAVKARLRDAVELGIEELTVYSFSTENWSRPRGGGRAG